MLHTFDGPGTDGCNPQAALIDVGGTLYGTTIGGGNYGCGIYSGYNYDACGTVFSITPGGKEKVLHYFGSYGSGDGSDPDAPLTAVKGTLYGTTWTGGRNFCPTIGLSFSLRNGLHGHAGRHRESAVQFFSQENRCQLPSRRPKFMWAARSTVPRMATRRQLTAAPVTAAEPSSASRLAARRKPCTASATEATAVSPKPA